MQTSRLVVRSASPVTFLEFVMPGLVNAIVVAESRLFREGLKLVVASPKISVNGASASFSDALEQLRTGSAQADLVIGEIKPDPIKEYQAIRALRSGFPHVKIIGVMRTPSAEETEKLVRHGVSGIFSSDLSAEALSYALELVLLGGTVHPIAVGFGLQTAAALPESADCPAPESAVAPQRPELPAAVPAEIAAKEEVWKPGNRGATSLSDREAQFLNCLLAGMSNKLIARHLDIAEATVKVHLRSVLRKLKVQNRTQAAIWALQNAAEPTQIAAVPSHPVSAALPRLKVVGQGVEARMSA